MTHGQTSMRGRTCLVTGTTGGIGKETALELASMGADVLMVARDRDRGETAAAEIRRRAPQGTVELLVADLSSLADVRELARLIGERRRHLHVLVNNVGVSKFDRHLTPEGLEVMFATNHLAPFLLTNLLLDLLRRGAPSRVVNVASDIHSLVRAIPWDDLQAERRFSHFNHYALTKLMNVLFTRELAKRLDGTGVTVNCLSPGHVNTGLGREARGGFALFLKLSRLWMVSAEKAAQSSVHLASSPEVEGMNGLYFGANGRPKQPSRLARDEAASARLWDISLRLCGISANPAPEAVR